MAQIQKGTTYITGDQVTAANLNALADSAILLPGAITDQTAKTVPLAADTVLIHSAADTALRKSTLTQLFANATGIPLTTGVTGTLPVANGGTGITSLGTGIATFLGTPSSANLSAALTDETGSGAAVFATSPTLVTPVLGTPASGTVTNLTGTASININGTVGATTANTGAFTTLSASTSATIRSGLTGLVIRDYTAGSLVSLYSTNVTASNTNYSLSFDGVDTYLNGATSARLVAAGTTVASATSTGLAVTGALSATGTILGANGFRASGAFPGNLASSVGFDFFSGSGRMFHWDSGGTGTQVFGWNATGLAVTGTLSSTTGANFATSSGSVGIGTASPGAFLTLSKNADIAIRFDTTDGTATARNWAISSSRNAYGDLAIMQSNALGGNPLSAGTARMYFAQDGNVGIGTTSPATRLTVAKSFNISSDGAYAASSASGTGLNFGFDGAGTERSWIQALRNNTSETRELQLNPLGGTVSTGAALSVGGALSKASGSFRIEHPLPEKSATHQLVHSFIEGPQADLIYRGKVVLVDGKASVNIDAVSTMTEGTFEVLCRDVQCFTTNETGWTAVRGKVTGNILTIEAKDADCTDEISWMVIGERQDPHMMETDWTDDNGKVIVEPLKPVIETSN